MIKQQTKQHDPATPSIPSTPWLSRNISPGKVAGLLLTSLLIGSVFTLCAATAAAEHKPQPAAPGTTLKPIEHSGLNIPKPHTSVNLPPNTPTVQIYLKNGDDLKGQVIAYQPNKLFIKTTAGIRALNLRYYHGLILDTPQEQMFGNSITHSEDVFKTAVEYTQKIRPLLNKQLEANLKKLPNVCKPTLYPILHMQFEKSGKVVSSQLLAKSNCPHLNLAIAQAAKQTTFPPLPKEYPVYLYVFNYFFPIPQLAATTPENPSPAAQKPEPAVQQNHPAAPKPPETKKPAKPPAKKP